MIHKNSYKNYLILLIFSGESDSKEILMKLKTNSYCLSFVYPLIREGWELWCAMTESSKEPRTWDLARAWQRQQEIMKQSN